MFQEMALTFLCSSSLRGIVLCQEAHTVQLKFILAIKSFSLFSYSFPIFHFPFYLPFVLVLNIFLLLLPPPSPTLHPHFFFFTFDHHFIISDSSSNISALSSNMFTIFLFFVSTVSSFFFTFFYFCPVVGIFQFITYTR